MATSSPNVTEVIRMLRAQSSSATAAATNESKCKSDVSDAIKVARQDEVVQKYLARLRQKLKQAQAQTHGEVANSIQKNVTNLSSASNNGKALNTTTISAASNSRIVASNTASGSLHVQKTHLAHSQKEQGRDRAVPRTASAHLRSHGNANARVHMNVHSGYVTSNSNKAHATGRAVERSRSAGASTANSNHSNSGSGSNTVSSWR